MATATITLKADTTDNWATSQRVLDLNEMALEVTTDGRRILRIGDGETPFPQLPATVDIVGQHQIQEDMETSAQELIATMERRGQELIDEMVTHEGTVVLTDDNTNIKYRMGFSDGMPYFEKITE